MSKQINKAKPECFKLNRDLNNGGDTSLNRDVQKMSIFFFLQFDIQKVVKMNQENFF